MQGGVEPSMTSYSEIHDMVTQYSGSRSDSSLAFLGGDSPQPNWHARKNGNTPTE